VNALVSQNGDNAGNASRFVIQRVAKENCKAVRSRDCDNLVNIDEETQRLIVRLSLHTADLPPGRLYLPRGGRPFPRRRNRFASTQTQFEAQSGVAELMQVCADRERYPAS
jgi:hypothetical protein